MFNAMASQDRVMSPPTPNFAKTVRKGSSDSPTRRREVSITHGRTSSILQPQSSIQTNIDDDLHVLSVGDVISLYNENTHNFSGYLSSEGFCDKSCRITTCEDPNTILPNFHACLFEVVAVAEDTQLILDDDIETANNSTEDLIKCYCCFKECNSHYYNCDKEHSFCILCPRCFLSENFPLGITQSDFEKTQSEEQQKEEQQKVISGNEKVNYGQAIQLRHVNSEKLLSFKTSSDRSSKDSLQLFLSDIEEDSWFNVLPCYKMYSNGERVHHGDDIKLVSVKWESIQTSFMLDDIGKASRVNISWKVVPFSTAHPIADRRAPLCGGAIIRLFHIQVEGLVTNASIDHDFDTKDSRQVLMKESTKELRKVGDSNTLWRIVLPPSLYRGGRQLGWSDKFHLQHCSTGKFLTVVKDKEYGDDHLKPVMTKDPSNSTLFQFESYKPTTSTVILPLDKVYLKHIETEYWLHSNTSIQLRTSIANNILSNTFPEKVFRMSFVKRRHTVDALMLGVCNPLEMYSLLNIKEIANTLSAFTTKLENREPISHSHSLDIVNLLKESIYFIILSTDMNAYTSDGSPVKNRQRLFRAQLVIKTLLDIVKIPYVQRSAASIPMFVDISILVYRLLSHIVKSYTKNALLIFEQVEFLKLQLKDNLKDEVIEQVVRCLGNIFENNHFLLVECPQSIPSLIDVFLNCASKERQTRYLQFLSVLCTSNGECVPSNQEYICNVLLDKYQDILFNVEEVDGRVIIYFDTDHQEIENFCQRSPYLLKFYLETLHLCAQLCVGRTYKCIVRLSSMYPYDTLFACVSNAKLPGPLRAQFCELMLNVHINSHPQQFINLVHYSRFWNDLSGKRYKEQAQQKLATKKGSRKGLEGQEMSAINWDSLKIFMREYLESYHQGDSKLTLSIITLCRYLVAFGLLEEDEINHFFNSLYTILEDKGNEQDQFLMEAKLQLCDILDMLTDRQLDHRMNKYLLQFQDIQNFADKTPVGSAQQKSIEDLLSVKIKNGEVHKINSNVTVDNIIHLTRLANTSLNLSAFRILFRSSTPKAELQHFVSNVTILVSQTSMDLYGKVRKTGQELRKALAAGNIKNSSIRQNRLKELIPQLTQFCYQESNPTIPNKERQDLIEHFKIHEYIIQVLRIPMRVKENKDLIELLQSCFEFLIGLCKNNHNNQQKLWNYRTIFLEYIHFKESVELFLALISNNIIICSGITEDDIVHFVRLIVREGYNPNFLRILNCIVNMKVNGKPLYSQQRMIVKTLLAHKETLVLFTHFDSERSKVNEIMNITEGNDKDSDLFQYHLELVDLLSKCAEDNYELKILCRTILSFEDLVNKLAQSKLSYERKAPFAHLLREIYAVTVSADVQHINDSLFSPKYVSKLLLILYTDIQLFKSSSSRSEKANEYVFDGIVPLLTILYNSHSEFFKQLMSNADHDFQTTSQLHTLIYSLYLSSGFDNNKKALLLQCAKALARLLVAVMLKRVNLPQKIQEEFSLNFDAFLSLDLSQLIIESNKSLPPEEVGRYTDRINELLSVLSKGDPTEISALVAKRKSTRLKTLTASAKDTIVPIGLRLKEDEVEMSDLSNEQNIKVKLEIFTAQFCDEDNLQLELSKIASLLAKEKNASSLEKLIRLLSDPSVLRQSKFEGTFLTALQVIHRIIVEYDIREKLCKMGIMKMVVRLLSYTHGKILEEAMKVGLAIVQGGFQIAQESILVYLKNSVSEENFFGGIHAQINQFIQELKQRQILGAGKSTGSLQLELLEQSANPEYIERMFLFLQLLCEGNHHKEDTCNYELQNLLRNQGETTSFNILVDILNYFCQLEYQLGIYQLDKPDVEIDVTNIQLARQVLSTLTDVVSGPNIPNQICLIETNRLFNPLNKILGISLDILMDMSSRDPENVRRILDLKEDVIVLLLAFLEGQTDMYISNHIISSVNIANLRETLKSYFLLFNNKQAKSLIPKESYKSIQSITQYYYILVNRILDYDLEGKIKQQFTSNSWFNQLADVFRNRYVGNIEIVRNEQLEKVYFKMPKMILKMWNNTEIKQVKHSISYRVNRENDYERIEDFFDKSQDLIFIMKLNWELQYGKKVEEDKPQNTTATKKTFRVGTNMGTRYKWFEDITYYLTFILNILILAGYHSPIPSPYMTSYDVSARLRTALLVIGAFHFIFSVFRLAGYYITRGPVKIERYKRHLAKLELRAQNEKQSKQWWERALNTLRRSRGFISTTWILFATRMSVYLLAYTALSLVGLYYPFVYIAHLVDTLLRFRLLRSLLKMVFNKNLNILAQTALLGIVIIYVYSILGFLLFRNDYDTSCGSTIQCFLFHLDNGLRAGGGIGDTTNTVDYDSTGHYIGRLVFDVTFFLIIVVILIAIISGIIIDSFGEIRDQLTAIKDDTKSKCFICSIDNSIFERHSDGFMKHTKHDHFMWSYLFFILYLNLKEKHTYTAQESYVDEMINQRDLSFFPIGRALCLIKKK